MLPEFSGPTTDRFLLEARVGGGGMGDIFRAVDQQTGEIVAVKCLRLAADEQEKVRFSREIQTLAELRHPNIVRYVGHGTLPDGRPFYAMEWLDGEDLAQRQRRQPLGMRDAVEVVRRTAAAMAAVHARGIVHRDLKLSNIFLVRGKGTATKLIDFGVVKPEGPDEFPTARGTIVGTPHFMAPEQARGEVIDARADVYSLGSVLFRLVTGRNVFETDHVIALLGRLVLEDPPRAQSVRFDVPDALDAVIGRAIARRREDRFENGGELARALARVGQLSNDPPVHDRSASAVRAALPEVRGHTLTGAGAGSTPARPGTIERRVVACLLVDLGGDSLGSETAAALRELLGEDTRLEPIVGEQLVAVLGVERSKGDEALRAARSALTVVGACRSARVAVAIGHAYRGRGNLAGEALDRAARQLEQAAPGQARVDAYASISLQGRFVVHDDGRGSVLVREDTTGFGTRQLLGKVTPTLGREEEIARLVAAYEEVLASGFPRACLVTGPAGIGKSRLRSELLARLEAAPRTPEVLAARGDPMGRGSSLTALGRALRGAMGLHEGESHAEQIDKVKRHVAARLPRTLRFLAAFLGELVGVPFPDESDEPLRAARGSPELMRSRLRMALEAYVRARADQIPQVLVLEDLHWADDTTLELVDWLLACQELRFAAFAFARPDLQARAPALWEARAVTRLVLGPLAPVDAERLVGMVLPAAPARIRADIVHRAGGNALFLEELIRCAAEGRSELPPTVQALVQLRLDRMKPSTRQVLRAASVFGQSFWARGVGQLVEHSAKNEIEELLEGEVITRQPTSRLADQEEYIFRQALVRDAAYASLLEEDRAAMHLAVGAWLEEAGNVDAGLVAAHAEAGGDKAKAAELFARATRQAVSQGASLEIALDFAERGLACGAAGEARVDLLLAKAQAALHLGSLPEATSAAVEASSLAPATSEAWVEAQRLAATALIEAGRSAEGDGRVAWALGPEFRSRLGPAAESGLLAARVRALVQLGQGAAALALADEAVAAARAANVLGAMIRAQDARVSALLNVGDTSGAVEASTSLLEAAEAAGDAIVATRARLHLGASLNVLGMFEEAAALAERALGDARAKRLRVLEGFALLHLGMAQARLGALDEGIEATREACRVAEECGVARLRVQSRVHEAVILVWRGAPGDLGAAFRLARAAGEETRAQPTQRAAAALALARVQLARRDFHAALQAAREAAGLVAGGPLEAWHDFVRVTYVEALLGAGAECEADEALDHAFRALIERLRTLRRPEQRRAYATRNEEIARLVDLAHSRLGRALPLL